MIPVTHFQGRDVAVFGLGRTGLAAVRALEAGGARVRAWDDNPAARTAAEEAGIGLTNLDNHDWRSLTALVLSPGVPLRYPEPHRFVTRAEEMDIPVIGDMELLAIQLASLPEDQRPKLVGITGTNGKSTTTALIGHILNKAGRDVRVGGNIGIGVLDLAPPRSNAVYVLELSSYQLDLVESLKLDVAVLLNITPDHLDRHGSMANYTAAKMRIFNNQDVRATAIVGMDDLTTQSCAMTLRRQGRNVVPVATNMALGRGVSVVAGRLFDNRSGRTERLADLRNAVALHGRHNHQNAGAAYAACLALGVNPGQIIDALNSFPGLAHRMEYVGSAAGVRFINDSKATNATATEQALAAFRNVYWIAGGRPKSEGIDSLDPLLGNVRRAYLIGEAQEPFSEALTGKVPTLSCATLRRALAEAFNDAVQAGDPDPVVMLSPACASFDQFTDFEARGNAFRSLVEGVVREADLYTPA